MKTLTKKKHFLLLGAGMLSLAVAGSVGAIAASADTTLSSTDGTNTKDYTLSYQQADAWTVTLPESITIGESADVSASGVNVENGKSLKVKVHSENYSQGWKLKNGENSIDYTLKAAANEEGLAQAENLTDNGEVLSVASGSGSAKVKAEVSGNPSTGNKAYTDTLTFSVSVE